MTNYDPTIRALLLAIVLLLGIVAFRPDPGLVVTAHAQAAQFDHIEIVAPAFLHRGVQGLLLLDKRNGNVWFMPRRDNSYSDAQLLLRLPFEQLDRAPR